LSCRKKYVKNCQIRHTYSTHTEEEQKDLLEEAVFLAQNDVIEGLVSGTEISSGPVVDAPESVVILGGKKSK